MYGAEFDAGVLAEAHAAHPYERASTTFTSTCCRNALRAYHISVLSSIFEFLIFPTQYDHEFVHLLFVCGVVRARELQMPSENIAG